MTTIEKIEALRQQLSLIIDDLEKATVEYEVEHKDANLKITRSRLNTTLSKLIELENEIKTSIREKEDVIEDSNRELRAVQKEILDKTTMTEDNMDKIRAAIPRENDAILERRNSMADIILNSVAIVVLAYGIYKL